MKQIFLSVFVLCWVATDDALANRDHGSWKKTLHDKADYFEKNTNERHNILGSYPSSVRLLPPKHYAGLQEGAWKQIVETGDLPPGWVVDQGTTGYSNVAHTSSWTGCYLTAEAFRVAFLRERYGENSPEYHEAYKRADEVIQAFRIFTLVSGQPGYLVRGIALGHGISYEERGGAGTRDLWGQGVGEYLHLRYRGGPSHHNYDQVFRGLGMYYFLAADERQKEAIRAIVADMSNWAHLSHDMRVMHVDGERESTVLIGGWRGLEGDDRPSGGSLMALCGLKIANAIVGNPKTERLYNEWIEKLGFRDPEKTKASIMGPPRSNYDDTDHLLGDLYLLNRLETDPQLLEFYRKCVKDSWEAHKDERMAWFNYVYWAVLEKEYGDPEGSLWCLQTHPTCRVFQPQLNSIRTDIEFETQRGTKQSKHPLPVYERASDNEYLWKGSPFQLDGWLSRIVTVYEISPDDPYVRFAADENGLAYWSNTRGEVWHDMPGLPRVRDFLFSPDYPWIAFAATDGGIYRTMDQGQNWNRVSASPAVSLEFHPGNRMVMYAVGPQGIYKSADLGERDMGMVWHTISGETPDGAVFAVDVRESPARLYQLTRHGFFTKTESEAEWTAFPYANRIQGFSEVDTIGGDPLWLRVDPHRKERIFRAVQMSQREYTGPWITCSDDGGKTWVPVVRELTPLYEWATDTKDRNLTEEDLRGYFALMREYRIKDLKVDTHTPDTWYGMLDDGVAVTQDAGKTWQIHREGLDIPRVQALWVPRYGDTIAVGTPAGMYCSSDQGQTWNDTPLILNGSGAVREEIGGAGYLTAYWMGRYHGFISDEEATAEWWKQ